MGPNPPNLIGDRNQLNSLNPTVIQIVMHDAAVATILVALKIVNITGKSDGFSCYGIDVGEILIG